MRGAADNIPKALDVLLRLPYLVRAEGAPEDEKEFRWWAFNAYLNAGHTAWTVFDLCFAGLYYESSLLLRNLLEVMVQLRYFESRKANVRDMLDPETERNVSLTRMFRTVAPGLEDRGWGLLSNAAHGRLAASVFRINWEQTHAAVGAGYDERLSTFVLNQFDPLMYGFLSLFPAHFPEYARLADAQTEMLRREAMAWLKLAADAHVQAHPRAAEWQRMMRTLVAMPPRPESAST